MQDGNWKFLTNTNKIKSATILYAFNATNKEGNMGRG